MYLDTGRHWIMHLAAPEAQFICCTPKSVHKYICRCAASRVGLCSSSCAERRGFSLRTNFFFTQRSRTEDLRRGSLSELFSLSVDGTSKEKLNEMDLEGHAHAVFEGSLIPRFERRSRSTQTEQQEDGATSRHTQNKQSNDEMKVKVCEKSCMASTAD